MADSFTKIYIQLVFAVKNRHALINPKWETDLHKYITGIIEQRGHKLLAIGGMPDHIHIFLGMKPVESISELVREVKKSSTKHINDNKWSAYQFQWQNGYGAFSYGESQIDRVCKYVLNQKKHHKKKTFEEEFQEFISKFNIEVGPKQTFDFFEDL